MINSSGNHFHQVYEDWTKIVDFAFMADFEFVLFFPKTLHKTVAQEDSLVCNIHTIL